MMTDEKKIKIQSNADRWEELIIFLPSSKAEKLIPGLLFLMADWKILLEMTQSQT